MANFVFDVKAFCCIRVDAATREEAERKIRDTLDCATASVEVPGGDPVLFEVSLDDGSLFLVDEG